MKPVPIGVRAAANQVVAFEHTLAAHHPQLPPVYSTPDMIRLMDLAILLASITSKHRLAGCCGLPRQWKSHFNPKSGLNGAPLAPVR